MEHNRISDTVVPHSEYLSDDQLKILLRYVKNQADEARRKGATRAIINELIISLILHSGLRANELCNLNIGDLPESHGENTICVRDIADNTARKIELDLETVRNLRKFVKLYRQNTKLGDPLFVNERGGRLSYMSLYSKLKIIGQKAGIAKLYPEILRHTYIIRLFDTTQDLRLVQFQAGHVHSASTARYVKDSKRNSRNRFYQEDIKGKNRNQSDSPINVRTEKNKTKASISSTNDQVTVECEACGKSVARKLATMIDSGQLLCPDCLKDLRTA